MVFSIWTHRVSTKDWIKNQEALRLKPYTDSMKKLSIGWGRNLDDNGISEDEANYLFDNDYARCAKELFNFSWYRNQPDNVQAALINMNFNLGLTKLLLFKKMISALEVNDYILASSEALNSLWAKQIGERAHDIASVMCHL